MAANSGGRSSSPPPTPNLQDWHTIIKPMVTYSMGSLSKPEFMSLLKAIIECKTDLAETVAPGSPHTVFYDVVTVLSAHILTAAANNDILPRSSFPVASQVSRILCTSLLARFPNILRSSHPILSVKTYINVIQEFCSGKLILSPEEVGTMLTLLKNQELPPKIQSSAPSTWDKEGTSPTVKESRRGRLDPTVLLYDQIALPAISLPTGKPMNELLSQEVNHIFQTLRANQMFIDVCLSLPILKTLHPEVLNLHGDVVRNFYTKAVVGKNSNPDLATLSEELNFVYRLLSMPLFSPIAAAADAQHLTLLGVSALHAAFIVIHNFYGSVTQAQNLSVNASCPSSAPSSNLSEEDYTIGIGIVSQAIWIQKRIAFILKDGLPQSTWLNFSFAMSKLVTQCIRSYMHHVSMPSSGQDSKTDTAGKSSTSKDPQKSASGSISLVSVQSVWNELITAMSALGIQLIQNFIKFYSHESPPLSVTGTSGSQQQKHGHGPASLTHFKIDTPLTNSERLKLFFKVDGFNEIELLIQIVTLSFRKACRLKLLKYSRQKFASSVETSEEDNNNPSAQDEGLEFPNPAPPQRRPTGGSEFSSSTSNSEGTHDLQELENIINTNNENEVEVEIEDENHSVSDFMTTEDEDEPDDDDAEDGNHSGNDADDEPILGKWFESVLSPPEVEKAPEDAANTKGKERDDRKCAEKTNDAVEILVEEFIRDRSCPHGFIESALTILNFLTKDILSSRNTIVHNSVKASFNEQMLTLIAIVMKDLDQEKTGTEIGAISTFFDDRLNHLFHEFSCEIGKLAQNIIAQDLLSASNVAFFLDQLKIDLNGNGRWPFALYPRSLAVLVQVILLKSDKEQVVVQILKRCLDTFAVDIGCTDGIPNGYADMPVEHAQALVFLFHILTLMQKKAIVIETANTLIKVSKVLNGQIREPHQLMSLGRLLLIFDYFLRQLYEPDQRLITQVQYNLFNEDGHANPNSYAMPKTQSNGQPTGKPAELALLIGEPSVSLEPSHTKPLPPARLFCDCLAVESTTGVGVRTESTSSCSSHDTLCPQPRFYNLIGTEPNYQENPKLDGLAMNFLMNKSEASHMDKIDYTEVTEALFKILEADVPSKRDLRSVHYIYYFLMRIFFSLPPPYEFLEKINDEKTLKRYPAVLYFIIWLPRLEHRIFSSWIKDAFSKQGLTAVMADELVAKTMSAVNKPQFLFRLLYSMKAWIEADSGLHGKCPGKIFGVEAVLSHVSTNYAAILNEATDKDKDGASEKSELEFIQLLSDILDQGLMSLRQNAVASLKLTKPEIESSVFKFISVSSEYLTGNTIAPILLRALEPPYKQAIDGMKDLNNISGCHFPPYSSSSFSQDLIPSESHLLAVITGHLRHFSVTTSLKHILGSIVQLFDVAINSNKRNSAHHYKEKLLPLLIDRGAEGEMIGKIIDFPKRDAAISGRLLELLTVHTVQIIANENLRVIVEEGNTNKMLEGLFEALKNLLIVKDKDKSESNGVFVRCIVLESNGELLNNLVSLLMRTNSACVLVEGCEFVSLLLSSSYSPEEAQRIITGLSKIPKIEELPRHLFGATFFKYRRAVESASKLFRAIIALSALSVEKEEQVNSILPKMLNEALDVLQENIRKDELANETETPVSFCHALKVLIKMANVSGEVGKLDGTESASGHARVFKQMNEWFKTFVLDLDSYLLKTIRARQLSKKELRASIIRDQEHTHAKLKVLGIIIEYMLEVGRGLQTYMPQSSRRQSDREWTPGSVSNSTPPNEIDDGQLDIVDPDLVAVDDPLDDDESGADDSDDEGVSGRLCTYTVTQKEFMSQHWYHCHSCGMTDRVGVCSVCAVSCHAGHDVTYAKFGSFFCDCGARADGGCISLVRRPSAATTEFPPTVTGAPVPQPTSTTNTEVSSTNPFHEAANTGKESGGRQLPSPHKNRINSQCSFDGTRINPNMWSDLLEAFKSNPIHTIDTLEKLKSVVNQISSEKSTVGAFIRVQEALKKLRSVNLTFLQTEDLMQTCLGSQEGAFENIKMQYNGDQGAQIRQLINSQIIRRNTIAPMSSPSGRRNFLAVSQEKGKFTVLQLGALGADGGRKKLQLPRLATLPQVSFTALTMATNPIRDDVLAICGLKDCQVIVLSGGSIASHLTIKAQLDNQNYIIRPIWIPGSSTELALTASDSVKIFDLAKDTEEPVYHFVLPAGKVRDATFAIQDEARYILIMGNDGRIYSEKLDENSSAVNGPYYVTSDVNYDDSEMLSLMENSANSNSSSGTSAEAKGVSIHYSHALKLLFYTYPNGKSYVGTLENLSGSSPLSKAVLITPASSGKPLALGLAQWTEVIGHPGLVFAMGANSVPHVLLLTGNGCYIQEIRMQGKVKPIDLVAIRHLVGPAKLKTALLMLCDDGSLKVSNSSEFTDFWLSPSLRPHLELSFSKYSGSGKSSTKLTGINKRMAKYTKIPGGYLFPADFFEHQVLLTEVEFGGNDLLLVYNPAQLKNRINNTGQYIVSSKAIGFNLEVLSTDASMAITGIRVFLGAQDVNRVPSFIQILGRTITVNMPRPRWYDIPLTRDESILADQKLTITFGPSHDSASHTIVDTVKVYGKSKDSFGWPDENEELIQSQPGSVASSGGNSRYLDTTTEEAVIEKVIINSLELCDISVTMSPKNIDETDKVLELATGIYLENYQPFNVPCRNLMCTVLANKNAFNDHRDGAVFSHCVYQLMSMDEKLEHDIDPELFHQVVMNVKNISLIRPQHIAQYPYTDIGFGPMDVTRVIQTLCSIFLKLVKIKPKNPYVVSVDRSGIQRVSTVAQALAEIIYSVMSSDISLVPTISTYLLQLLLSKEIEISVPVRSVFLKRMRPKNVKRKRPGLSPPETASQSPRDLANQIQTARQERQPLVEVDEPIGMLDNGIPMNLVNALEGGEEYGYPPVIDLQSDAEDEAMVELAIALSLQEQAGGAALAIQGIQEGLQALEEMHHEALHAQEVMNPVDQDEDEDPEGDPPLIDPSGGEGGAESDATASPPQSDDDEGSTAATIGSTMRNEAGGSESSGSSTGGGSGRKRNPAGSSGVRGGPSGIAPETPLDSAKSSGDLVPLNPQTLNVTNKPFRIALLRAMSSQVSGCESALSLIPLLQVALVILSELDGSTEGEVQVVQELMRNLLAIIKIEDMNRTVQWKRDNQTEMTLVILRMLSICVSRWRTDARTENTWIAKVTASTVEEAGIVAFCKEMLHVLRSTWKGPDDDEEAPAAVPVSASTLKPALTSSPPDLSPFFLKQYVKGHSADVLEELPILISEMALRLPYQIKKVVTPAIVFDTEWEDLLCEMLQTRHTPFVRRQARKLLLNIAGTRENYHLLRDLYHMNFHLAEFQKLIGYSTAPQQEEAGGIRASSNKSEFKYSQLVSMVEHLNTCIDIATQRPASWQTFCKSSSVLQFIVEMSCSADESLTTAVLTLLKVAVDGVPFESKSTPAMHKMSEEEKVKKSLAHHILDGVEKRTFLEFIKKYLLEHPQLSTRWQSHSLVLGIFLTSDCAHQLKLINAMWELWPFVPASGSRAAQYVDLLGYTTLNNEDLKSRDLRDHVNRCIEAIQQQGAALLSHPNASIYSSLVPFVAVDGYYLESEPCEVCYNIDKSFTNQKLSSIKSDAKFTAIHQFIKLSSTLNIIRLSMRLTEVKKARMIKTMAVYYSPKNISIVELKNHRSLWQLAKKVTLSPSQSDVKMEFSVPITAANLILEFNDFYENVQATAETLQCPRCSASVPAQPGVCSNCGENVFQCHKCRAINYDERDPFLCHSCGFCKYAKMDITLLAKTIVAVDPIENEEDHKKAEGAVCSFLEKADATYKQQQQMKAGLETMLQSIKEKRSMAGLSSAASLTTTITTSNPPPQQMSQATAQSYASVVAAANALNNNVAVLNLGGANSNGLMVGMSPANAAQLLQSAAAGANQLGIGQPVGNPSSLVLKNVQSLAYCYAIDCKNSYEELNRLMRKVGAYRKEMLKLDQSTSTFDTMDNVTCRRCYGCMASSITLSLKLLQALITAESPRDPFRLTFLSFLLRLSQSAGSTALKEQVKNALCFFVKDDHMATAQLTDMISSRVLSALNKETWSDVSFETSEEISLLASLIKMYDSCWEIKLRSLMKVFLAAIQRLKDPTVTDPGLLSLLKIIQNFIRAPHKEGTKETNLASLSPVEGVHSNLESWINGDENFSFENWRKRLPKEIRPALSPPQKQSSTSGPGPSSQSADLPPGVGKLKRREGRKEKKEKKEINTASVPSPKPKKDKEDKNQQKQTYLLKKYGRIWVEKFFKIDSSARLEFDKELGWMKKLIFCPGSIQTRTVTAALFKDLAIIPSRRLKIMELLTSFLKDLPLYGESCREFMELYRELATPPEYSAFLNAKGALNIVCNLLDEEIETLHHLEAVTLHSDLSQGVAVWELSRLLSTLAIPAVCRTKRKSLLSTVLGGYLALKRLRLHRTRPIDEAQEILLTLLEEITKGTEEETKVFMSVCVETLKKCPKEDLTTPVFVFERLCSLIVHEESDVAEFYVTIDKDPQQEDFLQGRMLGNPYSSNDSGIGPLMRDIKNKVCTDCELVALLEDDNGMELLVNNKIISLDLPVKEVYKRIWLPTNGQIEPMRVVYRMRGLLGDATEEFIETFAAPSDGQEDNETTYKLANVLVNCDGLKVVLNSLENLIGQQFPVTRVKPFIAVILKLLGYCVKIKAGRVALVNPELNAVQTLLPILQLCLEHDLNCIQGSSGVVYLADLVLEILDTILTDALGMNEVSFSTFAKSRGSMDDIKKLLQLTDNLKTKQATMAIHLKVLGGLTYTDKEKMSLIMDSYTDCWDFFRFDDDPNPDFSLKLEQICTLVSSIQSGPFGRTFKDLALERKALESCLEYIRKRSPSMVPPLGRPDADEWKEMVTRPALKYVLRLLAGFGMDHIPTQEKMVECVYVIHQLEQVSSDEHVGSLAENALEALRSHDKIWKEVQAARRSTREEKKRLAMAMRQRQLNAIGMKTNDKGQVTAAAGSTILDQMEDLAEESGLICVICREGYKYQPTKVLGIYTFSKRCLVEESETKTRKNYGYCTVSHFNVVHVDCHMAAIRLARARDEWESASLQNANTRCNGLIPLWGQQVPESAFAACLARHNAYLQEATGHRDVGFNSGAHDIKLLLLRFAEEKSFHEDTGGGGPESNMHLIPYLLHTALYVCNTTRVSLKESSGVDKFLAQAQSTWKDDFGATEGPCFYLVVSLMVQSPSRWNDNRVAWLKRIMSYCGYRSKRLGSAEFQHYRPGLIFISLIHGFYTIVFKDVPVTGEWSSTLADYIRKNDEQMLKNTSALLSLYQQKMLTATSIEDFIGIIGLSEHEELKDIGVFLSTLWAGV